MSISGLGHQRRKFEIQALEMRRLLSAQMVDDVDPTPIGLSIYPQGYNVPTTAANGDVFFVSENDVLWKTDGTPAGTGPAGSVSITFPFPTFISTGNKAFVLGGSGDLYVSDGTNAGTLDLTALTGIVPASSGGVINFNGKLIFETNYGIASSDGTAAGTAQFVTGVGFSDPVIFNGSVYFSWVAGTYTNPGPLNLYKLGTTSASLIASIPVPVNTYPPDDNITDMTVVGNTLFFIAKNGTLEDTGNQELWKSDGTSAGTTEVLNLPYASTSTVYPVNAVSDNGLYVFGAFASNGAATLYRSDGTAAGTVPFMAMATSSNLIAYNGDVYFVGYDSAHGDELWQSNLTPTGTGVLDDINPGEGNSTYSSSVDMTLFDGKLFFVATDGTGAGLWSTDGTLAGTQELISPDPQSGDIGNLTFIPCELTVDGSKLIFFDGYHGSNQVFVSDGTAAGTMATTDFFFGTDSSEAANLTSFNGSLLFSADNGLDVTNGTAAGTTNLFGGSLIDISGIAAIGGTGYFVTENFNTSQWQFWKTDGTVAGTTEVSVLSGASYSTTIQAAGQLVFITSGNITWRSDGTSAGTYPIFNGSSGGVTSNVLYAGGSYYFDAITGSSTVNGPYGSTVLSVYTLFRSDGTTAGTRAITAINAADLITFDNEIFFDGAANQTSAYTRPAQNLWKTDGTAAGTMQVSSGVTLAGATTSPDFTIVGNEMYFAGFGAASPADTASVLYKTDGTASGTLAVYGNDESGGPTSIDAIVALNGGVVISAGTYGAALWFSNGTASGTQLLHTFTYTSGLTAMGGEVYFNGTDATYGSELWQTDGTPTGTTLVDDINPGANSSNPGNFVVIGNALFFRANDGFHGDEPWKYFVDFASTSGNTLTINGASGGSQYLVGQSGGNLNVSDGNNTLTFSSTAISNISAGNITGPSSIELAIGMPIGLSFANDSGAITLQVDAGTGVTLTNPVPAAVGLSPVVNGTLAFAAGAGYGINPISLPSLYIGSTGSVIVPTANMPANRSVLTVAALTIATHGTLDLGGNDMIVHGGNLAAITAAVNNGYASGTWTGTGVTSSAAAGNSQHSTALGVLLNNVNGSPVYGSGTPLGLFDGQSPGTSDVLLKYTYYGDANLDGRVDGSDYSRIDSGSISGGAMTGWASGDFNYDGVINGSDYTLIDNAYNTQGASLAATIADPPAARTATNPATPDAQLVIATWAPQAASATFSVTLIGPSSFVAPVTKIGSPGNRTISVSSPAFKAAVRSKGHKVPPVPSDGSYVFGPLKIL